LRKKQEVLGIENQAQDTVNVTVDIYKILIQNKAYKYLQLRDNMQCLQKVTISKTVTEIFKQTRFLFIQKYNKLQVVNGTDQRDLLASIFSLKDVTWSQWTSLKVKTFLLNSRRDIPILNASKLTSLCHWQREEKKIALGDQVFSNL
jgi:hypothetical protein